jgi:hypothetical protein
MEGVLLISYQRIQLFKNELIMSTSTVYLKAWEKRKTMEHVKDNANGDSGIHGGEKRLLARHATFIYTRVAGRVLIVHVILKNSH